MRQEGYGKFLNALQSAHYKKAVKIAKECKLSKIIIRAAIDNEYSLVMKYGKYDWALEIAEQFNLDKSKIRKTALSKYNQLVKDGKDWPGGYWLAADTAMDYKLGKDKVKYTAEKAFDYYTKIGMHKDAKAIARKFGLKQN